MFRFDIVSTVVFMVMCFSGKYTGLHLGDKDPRTSIDITSADISLSIFVYCLGYVEYG